MKCVQTISRRGCLGLGAGLATSLIVSRDLLAAPQVEPVTVVELFSSQGCSSCLGAEQIFDDVRRRPGVLALAYHVDYWDYLGWKDTLASKDFSQRQYDYAKARGDMDVYTPQLIVNGAKPVVASQRSEVEAVLQQSRVSAWPVNVAMADTPKEIVIELGAGSPGSDATLWVMPIRERAQVTIEKGEMAGKELIYTNIVRRLVPAGMWNGSASRVALPKDGLLPEDCTACVAVLQQGKAGPVLGCAGWGNIGS